MIKLKSPPSNNCPSLISPPPPSQKGLKISPQGEPKAGFPLGEFVRANREKKQLDWLATNTDDIISQSHSLFACSREEHRQVENRLNRENTIFIRQPALQLKLSFFCLSFASSSKRPSIGTQPLRNLSRYWWSCDVKAIRKAVRRSNSPTNLRSSVRHAVFSAEFSYSHAL